jgi:hypothetical protein
MDGLLGISRKFPAKQRTTVSLVVGKNNMCVTPSKISKYRYVINPTELTAAPYRISPRF